MSRRKIAVSVDSATPANFENPRTSRNMVMIWHDSPRANFKTSTPGTATSITSHTLIPPMIIERHVRARPPASRVATLASSPNRFGVELRTSGDQQQLAGGFACGQILIRPVCLGERVPAADLERPHLATAARRRTVPACRAVTPMPASRRGVLADPDVSGRTLPAGQLAHR